MRVCGMWCWLRAGTDRSWTGLGWARHLNNPNLEHRNAHTDSTCIFLLLLKDTASAPQGNLRGFFRSVPEGSSRVRGPVDGGGCSRGGGRVGRGRRREGLLELAHLPHRFAELLRIGFPE